MDLTDRNVVITGAGRGIGAALAASFHARGANVVLADIAGAPEAARAIDPQRATGIDADVSTEEGNRLLVERATEILGSIDLFFANAGVGTGTTLADTGEDVWEQAFAVNVHAHRWAAKHLVDEWVARGEGYFCSTASAAGLLAQIGSGPYTLTKRAAVAFAEWMAITYGDAGIRVTCLCPQGVNTAMLHAGDDEVSGSDVVRAAGVVLEPDDVAEQVADAIERESFLVLPHPEVADYVRRKADDPERWLAGMRKLQRRVTGA
ncbi:SDR family oxidoreductase [Ilumatobacter sp.]|uniref:SDR family oxidoreductase n=1 Tax=Ilumatobacter sp. TaxID=1967498 RepID=UPI003B51C416